MNKKEMLNTQTLVQAAVIAAIYVVLTMIFAPISFGPVQFRVSEVLCILPFFTFAAVREVFLPMPQSLQVQIFT